MPEPQRQPSPYTEERLQQREAQMRESFQRKGFSEEKIASILRSHRTGLLKFKAIWEERQRTIARYGWLYEEVLAILMRHDPMGLIWPGDEPRQEYAPEAGTIVPKLEDAKSGDDVARIVDAEFDRWFGVGIGQGYRRERLDHVAPEIWAAWQRYRATTEG